MTSKNLPCREYLNECLSYDPYSGNLTWKCRPANHFKSKRSQNIFNSKFSGKIAGCVHNGEYIAIKVDGIRYMAHRIAYLIHCGLEPDKIDHIDGNGLNNRISNIRSVTEQENAKNRKLYQCSKTGFSGVILPKDRKKYVSTIRVNGKLIHLGNFENLSDAVKARVEAEIKYGFHVNHGER